MKIFGFPNAFWQNAPRSGDEENVALLKELDYFLVVTKSFNVGKLWHQREVNFLVV